MTIPTDARPVAREFLAAMEAGNLGAIGLMHHTQRLLYALRYPSAAPATPGESAEAILGMMVLMGAMPSDLYGPLKGADMGTLHRLVLKLGGRLDVRSKQIGSARLYAVVLCLARVADEGSILMAH
jgi:hypothetical protein